MNLVIDARIQPGESKLAITVGGPHPHRPCAEVFQTDQGRADGVSTPKGHCLSQPTNTLCPHLQRPQALDDQSADKIRHDHQSKYLNVIAK